MNPKLKILTGFLFFASIIQLDAQEYRFELGAIGGVSSYMGEANTDHVLKNPRPAIGLIGRLNLAGNMSLKANIGTARIAGSTVGRSNLFPQGKDISFESNLLDASLVYELGFAQYGVPEFMDGFSRFSPYIALGLGMTGYQADKYRITPHIPFGIGIRIKAMPRVNLGCEWLFKKTFSDHLDYETKVSGFRLDNAWTGTDVWNKNKDWYSILAVFITIDLLGTSPECYK